MMEDELIKIWQASPQVEQVKFEKSRLMLELDSSLKRIRKSWKYMLIRETIAAVIGIAIFTHFVFTHPFTLARIGSGLTILAIVYIIVRLLTTDRQNANNYSEPYLNYLYKVRKVLEVQKKVLDNVVYWYVLPLYPGVILILLAFVHLKEKINLILLAISSIIVMTIGVHLLNKWASKKYYKPRLQKIDELILIMTENDSTP
ncbi:MAG: hypothetical protein AAGA86_05190 [Bacteroidota bacterium]